MKWHRPAIRTNRIASGTVDRVQPLRCRHLPEAATVHPSALAAALKTCIAAACRQVDASQPVQMSSQQALLTMSNSLHWNLLGSFWQSMQAGPSAQGVQAPEVPELPCSTTAQ